MEDLKLKTDFTDIPHGCSDQRVFPRKHSAGLYTALHSTVGSVDHHVLVILSCSRGWKKGSTISLPSTHALRSMTENKIYLYLHQIVLVLLQLL